MTKSRLLQLAVFATTLPLWAALERLFTDPLARCIALWAVFVLLWGGVEFAARKGKVLLPVEKNTFIRLGNMAETVSRTSIATT